VYRALRSFRHVLFTDTPQLLASPFLRDVPPTVLAHHLLSRAEGAVETPMKRSGLTPPQYSLWLDSHTQQEILRGVSKAAAAAAGVNAQAGGDELTLAIRRVCEGLV
jgi:conserved oligomeric Golgi complex subunit 5